MHPNINSSYLWKIRLDGRRKKEGHILLTFQKWIKILVEKKGKKDSRRI